MDLPATDPLSPGLSPGLCKVARSLLVLAVTPWTFEVMRACWGVSTDVADQYEAALLEHRMIALLPDGRYTMPSNIRDYLLIELMNSGELDLAHSILLRWRAEAVVVGNLLTLATVHEHLANLLMLMGRQAGAIAEDICALALRQAAGDLTGVARLSWSIGAYYARHGERKRALPLLAQATTLAEKLGLAQAPRYRARLHQLRTEETAC